MRNRKTILFDYISGTLSGAMLPASHSAVELLVMIAAHESQHGRYVQQVNGPALGLYQMEPIGFQEVQRYIKLRADRFTGIQWVLSMPFQLLNYDQRLATIAARVFLMAEPEALPDSGDVEALGAYAKKHWNTEAGKATADRYVNAYLKF